MSRFNPPFAISPHASNTKTPSNFNPGLKTDRHDERASQSGSEDGSYALYAEAQKLETEVDEDTGNSLTSQTLNADGTPKRPMNAFMIFARRRRPQVSAENQSMRTGEISKILSKEWVSMPASEKQFYLEQAKQLKDTFNNKYPDYVYRRRPNNSRKRRRSEGGLIRSAEHGSVGDPREDLGGSIDLDASPIIGGEHVEGRLPPSYPRPHDVPHGFVSSSKFDVGHPRTAGHPYASSDSSYRSNSHDDGRNMSYPTGDRMNHSLPSPRLHQVGGNLPYPFVPSQGNNHGGPVYSDTDNSWPSRMPSNWVGGGPDRQLSLSTKAPYSPTQPNSWPNPPDASGSGPGHSSPGQNYFPTLNTPFFPNQSQMPNYPSTSPTSPSSVSPQSASSSHYNSIGHHPPSNTAPRDYPSRSYSSSSSVPSTGSYPPPNTREGHSYSQRNLPPMQNGSGSAYQNHPPSSSSNAAPSAHGYWSRE